MSGGGNAQPSADETVGIPGLYDNVQFPDVWTETFTSWPAPGPPVVSFASGSGSENSSPPSSSAGVSTQSPGQGESSTSLPSGSTTTSSRAGSISKPTYSPLSALTGPRQCRLQSSNLEASLQRRSWILRYFEL